MATSKLSQENFAIASDSGIPRLERSKGQKNYYSIHLRNCVNLLKWIMAFNMLLIFVLLYLFFTKHEERTFVTSFDGKVTQINYVSKAQALAITEQNYISGNSP